MQPGGPVRQPYSYSVTNPKDCLKIPAQYRNQILCGLMRTQFSFELVVESNFGMRLALHHKLSIPRHKVDLSSVPLAIPPAKLMYHWLPPLSHSNRVHNYCYCSLLAPLLLFASLLLLASLPLLLADVPAPGIVGVFSFASVPAEPGGPILAGASTYNEIMCTTRHI